MDDTLIALYSYLVNGRLWIGRLWKELVLPVPISVYRQNYDSRVTADFSDGGPGVSSQVLKQNVTLANSSCILQS